MDCFTILILGVIAFFVLAIGAIALGLFGLGAIVYGIAILPARPMAGCAWLVVGLLIVSAFGSDRR
jgi:hypothetical protein